MTSYSIKKQVVATFAGVVAAISMTPVFASHIADDVNRVVQQKFDQVPVEVLPTEKPDAVLLRGGPLPHTVADKISMTVAKVSGVNEIINELNRE